MTEFLKSVGQEILDDKFEHCTADPFFIVYRKRKIYGVDPDYTDLFEYYDVDYCDDSLIDPSEIKEDVDNYDYSYVDEEGTRREARKVGYVTVPEFVQVFLSEPAAKRWLESNKYKLGAEDYYIYVESACRNSHIKNLRESLKEIATESKVLEEDSLRVYDQ